MQRLVSTFATQKPGDGDDFGPDFDDGGSDDYSDNGVGYGGDDDF